MKYILIIYKMNDNDKKVNECPGIYEQQLISELSAIKAADECARAEARARWDALAKPIDGLGRFERIIADIAGMTGSSDIRPGRHAVVIMCSDHGITAEGVSQTDSAVTAVVAEAIAAGTSTVNMMAKAAGADVYAVDMGMVVSPRDGSGIIDMHVRRGTANIAEGPAMTREEAARAVLSGLRLAVRLSDRGYSMLAAGEMGIGNTTPMTCIACILSDRPAELLTGRGAGLSDEGLLRKISAVGRALEVNRPDANDALDILSKTGGLEIAGMTGLYLGGALCRIPVIADGAVSLSAAVLASMLRPEAADYIVASCAGREPAAEVFEGILGKKPVIDADIALGEGTAAVMMFPLLDMAMNVYNSKRTFEAADISAYTRFEHK